MPSSPRLVELLEPGDLRTIGAAPQVAELVSSEPERVAELLEALEHPSPGVRMRAADALQKAAIRRSDLLKGHEAAIVEILRAAEQKEVQWHLAQIVRVLRLTDAEAEEAAHVLERWLRDSRSAIVRAESLETLALLGQRWPSQKTRIDQAIAAAVATGPKAVVARARKINAVPSGS